MIERGLCPVCGVNPKGLPGYPCARCGKVDPTDPTTGLETTVSPDGKTLVSVRGGRFRLWRAWCGAWVWIGIYPEGALCPSRGTA